MIGMEDLLKIYSNVHFACQRAGVRNFYIKELANLGFGCPTQLIFTCLIEMLLLKCCG
jgi:hypothetical protein